MSYVRKFSLLALCIMALAACGQQSAPKMGTTVDNATAIAIAEETFTGTEGTVKIKIQDQNVTLPAGAKGITLDACDIDSTLVYPDGTQIAAKHSETVQVLNELRNSSVLTNTTWFIVKKFSGAIYFAGGVQDPTQNKNIIFFAQLCANQDLAFKQLYTMREVYNSAHIYYSLVEE